MSERFRQRPSAEAVRERYGTPLSEKEKNRPLTVVDTVFDFSGSMEAYYAVLIECFTDIFLPGLLGASRKQVAAVRLGTMFFSDEIVKPWNGFLSLDEVSARPLTKADYTKAGLMGGTALYRALIESMNRTNQFCSAIRKGTAPPTRKIMALTDGANNLAPRNPSDVFNAIKIFRPTKNDMVSLAYFKTKEGLSEREFKEMAKATGVTQTYFADLTNSRNIEESRRNFRHHFGIFSSQTF